MGWQFGQLYQPNSNKNIWLYVLISLLPYVLFPSYYNMLSLLLYVLISFLLNSE